MITLRRRTTRATILSAVLAFGPTTLTAQTRPAEPTDTLAPIPIEPVTVTVLRSPIALRNAPLAITAIDVGAVRTGGAGLALDEALRGVPGVQIDNRYNHALGERVSIRGFGARSQFGIRGVKILVDGVPATLPDGQSTLNHVDLGTLRRVEIVRGPASAVYGNAAGGVIQLETEPPAHTPFRQEVRFLSGEHGLFRLQSRTSGTVGKAAYQLNLGRLGFDGYREHNKTDNIYVSGQLGYHGERDEARLSFAFVDYDAQNPGSLSDSLLALDRTRAFPNNVLQQTGETGRQAQLGATWRRSLGDDEFELSAYGITRNLENPIPPRIIDLDRVAGGVRAVYRGGLRLAGRDARWTAGLEGDLQHDDRKNFRNERGERAELSLDQLEKVGALGGFVQLSSPLTDRLSLLGGLRYDRFRFQVEDHFVSESDPDDSGTRVMDAISPSLGLVLDLGEAVGIFANVGTAFQTPTTTELANSPDGSGGFNPELEPQHALSLEAGLRGRLGAGTSYQLSVYRTEVENELIGFEIPSAPGRSFFRNTGSTVHRGLEAEAAIVPTRYLTARVAYSFTDVRFETYRTEDGSFDGNRVPGVAPHRFETTIGFLHEGDAFDLTTRYVSKTMVDDANTATSPPYAVTDFRANFTWRRLGGIEVAPFFGVDNLFDREYNTSVVVNAAGGRYFEPGPGRSFFAGLNLRFGGK